MDNSDLKQHQNLIILLRWFSLFLNFFGVVQLVLLTILHDEITLTLRIWIVSITGSSILGVGLALLLSRKDTKITLIFVVISVFFTGVVCTISTFMIIQKVK
jgi:hypothetical protein